MKRREEEKNKGREGMWGGDIAGRLLLEEWVSQSYQSDGWVLWVRCGLGEQHATPWSRHCFWGLSEPLGAFQRGAESEVQGGSE